MFTDLYVETTNPKLTLSEFLSARLLNKMATSVLFHTILYVVALNMVSYVFGGTLSLDVNIRLSIFLVLVMSVGFVARFYRVKELYHYGGKEYVDKAYITWYFLS